MVEKRKASRSRTLLGGVIAFNNRASTMDCQVRNLSAGGAKVTFSNTAAVPDQFDLKIARKERSFRARMIWRAPNEAGIAFLSEYNQDVRCRSNGRSECATARPKTQPCTSASRS